MACRPPGTLDVILLQTYESVWLVKEAALGPGLCSTVYGTPVDLVGIHECIGSFSNVAMKVSPTETRIQQKAISTVDDSFCSLHCIGTV